MRGAAVALAVLAWTSAVRAVECSCCKLPATEGTLMCWACGSHLPGAPHRKDVLTIDLSPIRLLIKERSPGHDLSDVPPEVAYDTIERWIEDNPKEYDKALTKLETFMLTARGTQLEGTVLRRIEQIKALSAKATRPKSPQEQLAEAAQAYTRVVGQVRGEPDRVIRNIRLLEDLLKTCKGTPYEKLVERQLEKEREKQSR